MYGKTVRNKTAINKTRTSKSKKGGKDKVKGVDASVSSIHQSSKLSNSITILVRREVSKAMENSSMSRDSLYGAGLNECSEIRFGGNTSEFVKLDDLKDIVHKLLARNLVKSLIESNAKQVQGIMDKILVFEEKLKKITERIAAVEQSLNGNKKAKEYLGSQQTEKEIGVTTTSTSIQATNTVSFTDSSLLPQIRNCSKARLPPLQNTIPNTDVKSDVFQKEPDMEICFSNEEGGRNRDEKTYAYNKLMAKFNQQPMSKADFPSTQGLSEDLPPSKSFISRDLQFQVAERRQFQANMLLYRKSFLTLQLNRNKDHFPNELLVDPKFAKLGTKKSTSESASEWLFDKKL